MTPGFNVDKPYYDSHSPRDYGDAFIFVSNGDGTGELYHAEENGYPHLDNMVGRINIIKDGDKSKFEVGVLPDDHEAYKMSPQMYSTYARDREEAWKRIVDYADSRNDGDTTMFQAIKVMRDDRDGIMKAVSVHKIDSRWAVRPYMMVKDRMEKTITGPNGPIPINANHNQRKHGKLVNLPSTSVHGIMVLFHSPDFTIRVLKQTRFGSIVAQEV